MPSNVCKYMVLKQRSEYLRPLVASCWRLKIKFLKNIQVF